MTTLSSRLIPVGGLAIAAVWSVACAQIVPVAVPVLPTASQAGVLSPIATSHNGEPGRDVAGARPPRDPSDSPRDPGVSPPARTEEPAAPLAATTLLPRAVVSVRRGGIAETLQLNGRVVGVDEAELSFPVDGVLKAAAIEAGQAVKRGDVLLELEAKQVIQQLSAARARVETGRIRLDQARARADMDRRTAEQQLLATREQVETSSRAAEMTVALARAALDRAQADLARVIAPPSVTAQQFAEQQVVTMRVALQRAVADQERVGSGPDLAALRTAERDVTTAETALNTAQRDLQRLTERPDPVALRVAELQLEQARANLSAAEAADTGALGSSASNASAPASVASVRAADAARMAAMATARMGVLTAQDRLTKLGEPPDAAQVETGRSRLADARRTLAVAQDRLDVVRRGPDQITVDTANAEVVRTRAALEQAEEQIRVLLAGPADDVVRQATSAVENARSALANADLQALVAAGKAGQPIAPTTDDVRTFDLLLLERGLDQELATVQALENEMAAGVLRAPFAGVVASVAVQRGSPVEADRPVMVLAPNLNPLVVLPLLPADAARVSPGQAASIQVDGGDGTRFAATVLSVGRSPAGAGNVSRLRVDWGSARPVFGATVRAGIIVDERSDALLVPRRAVRSAGGRQYVEYVVGDDRNATEVTVGLTTPNDAEILTGVDEGLLVLVP